MADPVGTSEAFAWFNEIKNLGAYGAFALLLWGLKAKWWYMASHVELQDKRLEDMKADRDYHRKAADDTRDRFDRAMDTMDKNREITDRALDLAQRNNNRQS